MSWQRRARCAESSAAEAELFFSEELGPQVAALDVCGGCPVRRECLLEALERPEEYGVWGGHTAEQREVLRGQLIEYARQRGDGD